jgi:prepilin-type N-terminal cleavage/methylation domain-containing protein
MSDERGFTLVEMLVTMAAGLIVFMAILATIDVATRSQQRVDQRVAADQRARPVMAHVINELHSACVATGIAPVLAGDDGSITFLSKTGSDVSPVPDKHVITLTGTTLSETTYQGTGGTAPDWTFSSSPTTVQLLDGVGAGSVDGSSVPLFRYYAYTGGQLSSTPLPTPLAGTDPDRTVEVSVAFAAFPTDSGPSALDSNAAITVSDSAALRLQSAIVPADPTEANKPCE